MKLDGVQAHKTGQETQSKQNSTWWRFLTKFSHVFFTNMITNCCTSCCAEVKSFDHHPAALTYLKVWKEGRKKDWLIHFVFIFCFVYIHIKSGLDEGVNITSTSVTAVPGEISRARLETHHIGNYLFAHRNQSTARSQRSILHSNSITQLHEGRVTCGSYWIKAVATVSRQRGCLRAGGIWICVKVKQQTD